jgi:hypothetical protein
VFVEFTVGKYRFTLINEKSSDDSPWNRGRIVNAEEQRTCGFMLWQWNPNSISLAQDNLITVQSIRYTASYTAVTDTGILSRIASEAYVKHVANILEK